MAITITTEESSHYLCLASKFGQSDKRFFGLSVARAYNLQHREIQSRRNACPSKMVNRRIKNFDGLVYRADSSKQRSIPPEIRGLSLSPIACNVCLMEE